MKELNKENNGINFLKFFFAICVIAIHSNLETSIDENIYGYIVNIVLRCAVPFFFLCSGFFYSKYLENKEKNKRCFESIIRHYIFWAVFYFLLYILIYLITKQNDKIIQLIYMHLKLNSNGAIWYISALLFSYLIIYCTRKSIFLQKVLLFLSLTILLFVETISYISLFTNCQVIDNILNFIFVIKSGIFNCLYFGLFFTLTGYLIGKSIKNTEKYWGILLISGLVFTVIQTFYQINTNNFFAGVQVEIPYGIILLSISLLLVCKKYRFWPNYNTINLRKMSSTIFYIHYFFITLFKFIFINLIDVNNSICIFISSTILSIVVAYILNFKISNKREFIKSII